MKVHEIVLRASDSQGLWAELGGENDPVPDIAWDACPAFDDLACTRRDCARRAMWVLTTHRRHSRRDPAADDVYLCDEDYLDHRAGISFLVGVESNR